MNKDLKEVSKSTKCMAGGKIFQEKERTRKKALNWASVLEQVSRGRGGRRRWHHCRSGGGNLDGRKRDKVEIIRFWMDQKRESRDFSDSLEGKSMRAGVVGRSKLMLKYFGLSNWKREQVWEVSLFRDSSPVITLRH